MPGYVIHLAEARQILDIIKEQTEVSYDWEQRFLTGTLLPDTRLKGEKRISHFWNPGELDMLALAPDLSLFLGKYRDRLTEPVLLGYLAHLHLDACYVQKYWPTVIAFFGRKGEPETEKKKIMSVEIKRLHRQVPVGDFFSPEYYYGEYTKLNGYFIDKYHLAVPHWEQISEFQMDEVKLQDMACICRELSCLLEKYHMGDEGKIQVFDLNELEGFVTETAHAFTHLYGNYLVR